MDTNIGTVKTKIKKFKILFEVIYEFNDFSHTEEFEDLCNYLWTKYRELEKNKSINHLTDAEKNVLKLAVKLAAKS